MYVRMNLRMYIYVRTYVRTCVRRHVRMHVCMCVYIYILVYVCRMYVRTPTYAHTTCHTSLRMPSACSQCPFPLTMLATSASLPLADLSTVSSRNTACGEFTTHGGQYSCEWYTSHQIRSCWEVCLLQWYYVKELRTIDSSYIQVCYAL